MLKLKEITKVYGQGENEVYALKGLDVEFTENGVVSVLGASGCGKTTLLNIIGGLDKYTDGDLIIDNVSTKDYKNADWDKYRNNNVGFVFQNYYLIPHLSVLENVMMAMDLSGVNHEEQKRRALDALEKVGLKDQIKKRPKQLSGGQAQRVAIARAISNNPKIILADEPTGALDSENSEHVLELLKSLGKEAIVIIVTHNSELADKYSDRIIKMKDGLIISDKKVSCDTVNQKAEIVEEKIEPKTAEIKTVKKSKRPTMGFFSAFKNSLKNLFYKKGRTILTAIAGCIGVVSISLILALNSGFNAYAINYQKESLSKYPITVNKTQSSIADIADLVNQMSGNDFSTLDTYAIMNILGEDKTTMQEYTDEQKVYVEKLITGLGNSLDDLMKENDTTLFKQHVDENFNSSCATIKYDYDLDLNVYSINTKNNIPSYTQICPFGTRTSNSLSELNTVLSLMGLKLGTNDIKNIQAALDNINFWDAMVDNEEVISSQYDLISGSWPKDDLENNVYETVLVVDKYNRVSDASLYALGYIEFSDMLQSLLLNSTDIIKKLTGADFSLMIGKELDLEYEFNEFLGREFKIMLNSDYYALNENGMYENKKDDALYMRSAISNGATVKISGIVRLKNTVSSGCINGDIGYTQNLVNYIINETLNSDVVKAQKAEYEKYMLNVSSPQYQEYLNLLTELSNGNKTMETLTQEEKTIFLTCSSYKIKSVVVTYADMTETSSYDTLMLDLGVKDTNEPNSILFYPENLEAVTQIEQFIDEYNVAMKAKYDNGETITNNTIEYQNELDTIMNSMTEMISTITYILIAVTCLAVIVSLFMVGIIMYISVQDRTKEIGILRSMGARSIDILNIFNTETMLLGFFSGVLGVAISYALMPVANTLLASYLSMTNLMQPIWWHSLILIGASIILTAISGLAPAIMASKKDPVLSLRTE